MKKITLFAAAFALMLMPMAACTNSSSEKASDNVAAEQVNEASEPSEEAVVTPEEAQSIEEATQEEAEATEKVVEEATRAKAEAPAHAVISCKDDSQFRPDKKVKTLTVIDFNATWCVPCKKLTPAYDLAAAKFNGKVEFYSVDIDVNPETAKAFGVTSVPTVVILSPNGKVESFVGLGPFLKGLPEGAGNDAAVLTATITDNLVKAINAAK